jgi:hypothetical protein
MQSKGGANGRGPIVGGGAALIDTSKPVNMVIGGGAQGGATGAAQNG